MKMAAPLEVGISCADLDRMIAFYCEMLDCSLIGVIDMPAEKARATPLAKEGYKVCRLQTPYGERIKFLQPDGERAAVPAAPEVLLREGAFFLTFIVADLDALLAKFDAAGVAMLTGYEKTEARPGLYLAFALDPEGNVIELVQYDDIASYRPDLVP